MRRALQAVALRVFAHVEQDVAHGALDRHFALRRGGQNGQEWVTLMTVLGLDRGLITQQDSRVKGVMPAVTVQLAV